MNDLTPTTMDSAGAVPALDSAHASHGTARIAGSVLCVIPVLAVLLFVGHYATRVPMDDIWNQIQVLEGSDYDHSAIKWLFSPHNEHRMPVTRLALFVMDH